MQVEIFSQQGLPPPFEGLETLRQSCKKVLLQFHEIIQFTFHRFAESWENKKKNKIESEIKEEKKSRMKIIEKP